MSPCWARLSFRFNLRSRKRLRLNSRPCSVGSRLHAAPFQCDAVGLASLHEGRIQKFWLHVSLSSFLCCEDGAAGLTYERHT